MKPEQRAEKYRAVAAEIRAVARSVALEEARTSLLNLANAYERLANTADGKTGRSSLATDSPSDVSALAN